jgi:hypothetical protein
MLLYSDVILLRDSLDGDENAAPTSRIYEFLTVIQMITEYHILWHFAALQWHNGMTKILYYPSIRSLLTHEWIRDQFSDCLAFVSPEFPFLDRR